MENSISSATLLSGNVAWFFPGISFEWKIVIFLSGLLSAALIVCIKFYKENRFLKQQIKKAETARDYWIDASHKQKRKLDSFRQWWKILGNVIGFATLRTREIKFNDINRQYIQYTESIRSSGGFENDDDK